MSAPKLTPYKDGPKRYRVDTPKSIARPDSQGKKRRVRRFFPTEEKAWEYVRQFKKGLLLYGTSLPNLRPADLYDADEALRLIKNHALDYGIKPRPKLRELAIEWMERWESEHSSVTLRQLFELFLLSRNDHISDKHERSLGYTKSRFKPLWKVKACDLNHTEIEDRLEGLPPHSFNAHLRRVRSVLNYGVKHKYLAENPALRIERRAAKRAELEILPVGRVEQMLHLAQAKLPELLPFLTIGLFTGVRVEEIGKLKWVDFNLADKVLVIRPDISKTEKRRYISLADSHMAWLSLINKRPEGKVLVLTPTMLRNRRRKLWRLMRAEDASLPRNAPPNCLRHAFSSYHLAKHDNIAELCRQSGHSSAVMFEHYQHAVGKADAERYWQIKPA